MTGAGGKVAPVAGGSRRTDAAISGALANAVLHFGRAGNYNCQTNHQGGCPMKKWRCNVCGYIYDPAVGDPANGVPPGTPFEKIPADWVCPLCGVGKEEFEAAG